MHTNPLREWALWLAERGWHVFPLVPHTKRPAVRRWEQRATTDPERIHRCWSHAPYNIGLACGPSDLVVLDLDTADPDETAPDGWNMFGITGGADVLAELARTAGETEPVDTFAVATASGGQHLYFRAPDGPRLRNTTGALGWKLDTRAAGGYVVAPGSVLPHSGYELTDDRDPVGLPDWLWALLRPATPAPVPDPPATERPSDYLTGAINGEVDRIRSAQPGQHNKSVFIASCALGQLVAGGSLDPAEARAVLQRAAEPLVTGSCRCTEAEVRNTIESGLKAGHSRPRHLGNREAA